MLSKKKDSFINCVREDEFATDGSVSASKRPPPSGPSLYLRDIDLPLTDEDIDKTLFAEIKFIPKRLTKESEGGKISKRYDLEIRGIRIKT